MKKILRKILYTIPFTKRICEWRINVLPIEKLLKANPKAVVLGLVPLHGNLGDHAIVFSERELLKKHDIDCIEINEAQLFNLKRINRMNIFDKRIVLMNGGGNLGTLWPEYDSLYREIVKNNPNSHIVIFPNTAFYEDSDFGRSEFELTKRIFNSHTDLKIYTREELSYTLMNDDFKNVLLCPDVVLSLKRDEAKSARNGCLLCLRYDKERTRSEEEERIIIEQVEKIFQNNYTNTSLKADVDVTVENRDAVLNKKFDEFKSAKLVITDRLHGMIFCAITSTPCIVVNSKSPKVVGCYEWIKELGYIRLAENVGDIAEVYEQMSKESLEYDNSKILHYYDKMMTQLKDKYESQRVRK